MKTLVPCYYLDDTRTQHITRARASQLLRVARSRRRDNVLRTELAWRVLDCGLVILRGYRVESTDCRLILRVS